jgi:hypothetical protein
MDRLTIPDGLDLIKGFVDLFGRADEWSCTFILLAIYFGLNFVDPPFGFFQTDESSNFCGRLGCIYRTFQVPVRSCVRI